MLSRKSAWQENLETAFGNIYISHSLHQNIRNKKRGVNTPRFLFQ
jgi:hypothetical protein